MAEGIKRLCEECFHYSICRGFAEESNIPQDIIALASAERCPDYIDAADVVVARRKAHTPPTAEVVPITNEMHLRAMTQQDLVDLLYRIYLTSADGDISRLWCDGKVGCIDEAGKIQCDEESHKACIFRWLQSPYTPKEEST